MMLSFASFTALVALTALPGIRSESLMCGDAYVVVANRASGDITLISDGGDAFNVTLEGPVTPEPMYVSVYGRDVYVGDRANDRIIKFADADFDATPTYIDSCGGIFHMWNNGVQLWVSCNVDNAVDVIDLATATVVQTIDVNSTGVPHDIVATAGKGFATIFVQNDADKILSFETATFAPVDELTVGEDPHVGVMAGSTTLVSPQQGANSVSFFDMTNLADAPTVLTVPSAHGITFGTDHVYVTNIAGGGDDAIYTIALATQTIVGGGMMDPVDGLPPTPHNVAVAGSSLFITHSGGTSTQVSKLKLKADGTIEPAVAAVQYTAGTNPFGIASVVAGPCTSAPTTSPMTDGTTSAPSAAATPLQAILSLLVGLVAVLHLL